MAITKAEADNRTACAQRLADEIIHRAETVCEDPVKYYETLSHAAWLSVCRFAKCKPARSAATLRQLRLLLRAHDLRSV
jgi:hypothetical protein